jgi:signal transduction histidine kinase
MPDTWLPLTARVCGTGKIIKPDWRSQSWRSGAQPRWAAPIEPRAAGRLQFLSPGEPAFEFTAPVRGSGAPDATTVLLVGLAKFRSGAVDAPAGSWARGAERNTVYLINRDLQTLALRGAVRSAPNVAARALSGGTGVAWYKNAQGVPVVGVYRWLGDLDAALMAEQDQAEAFARSDELAAGLIGMVLGVALLTTIIAAIVTRQITRPIVVLTEAALKMSEGDLSVRVPPTRRDEIGILGNVFNTMASELTGLYAGLEQKVAERTREVQEAKEQIQYHAWQLSISAEIGRITTSILDLKTLLRRASELIRDAFQLDHVAVYLLDHSGQTAQLYDSVGRGVPAHEHELSMNGAHPIVGTISQRMTRTISRRHHDGTPCNELVLPLAVGARTIGALDLTTCDPAGFVESDQSVLQTLAGQLSVAIENARTYSQEHQAADEMREIDRLRGQFLMRMSHQMATYLNTILGFSKLMLKGLDGPLNEMQTKDLTAIRRSSQQLAQLLQDILELANLEVGAIELHHAPVDVRSLMEGMQGSLAALLVNPQVRLEMRVEPDLPELVADADRLRQVLTNLVVTAAEMSHEGVIAVQAARRANQLLFQVAAPAPAPHPPAGAGVAGTLRDNDHAISMALSRKLVDLHGGQLQMEHRESSLTVFSFGLPLNGSAAKMTEPESAHPQEVA